MGQYWEVVNLDKKERVCAHKLGVGLKLGEQIGSGHGSPDALFILVAAMRGRRGGGDFDWDSNYYGPERDMSQPGHGIHGGPVVDAYNEVAKRTIGRWAGDRITVVGDYSEDADLPGYPGFGAIYGEFTDISEDVARVIEHECHGRFEGDGWRRFKAA